MDANSFDGADLSYKIFDIHDCQCQRLFDTRKSEAANLLVSRSAGFTGQAAQRRRLGAGRGNMVPMQVAVTFYCVGAFAVLGRIVRPRASKETQTRTLTIMPDHKPK